jgi:hypothetical protein
MHLATVHKAVAFGVFVLVGVPAAVCSTAFAAVAIKILITDSSAMGLFGVVGLAGICLFGLAVAYLLWRWLKWVLAEPSGPRRGAPA